MALERGAEGDVNLLLAVQATLKITLSISDQWMKKGFLGHTDFPDQEFLSLPLDLRETIYRLANVYGNDQLVKRLNTLGMKAEAISVRPMAPMDLLNGTMDTIEAGQAIETFLIEQRSRGSLLTRTEFEQRYSSANYTKEFQLGSVLCRDFLEKTARSLRLKYIKIPRKIMLIHPCHSHSEEIHFKMENYRSVTSSDFEIYAEKIEKCNRWLSIDEIKEWIMLIEAVGFGKLDRYGFTVGKDGLYFNNITPDSFFSINYDDLYKVGLTFLHPKDHVAFKAVIEKHRKPAIKTAEEQQISKEQWEKEAVHATKIGLTERQRPFRFLISEIIKRQVSLPESSPLHQREENDKNAHDITNGVGGPVQGKNVTAPVTQKTTDIRSLLSDLGICS